jgi:hypothetical protein
MGPSPSALGSREGTARELDTLAEAADRMEGLLAAVSAETRARLFGWFGSDIRPEPWPDGRPLPLPGQLIEAARELVRLKEYARREAAKVRVEQRPRGRPANYAAQTLSESLATTWKRYTGKNPTKGRGGKRSPWEDFVCTVFAVGETGIDGEKLARRAVTWLREYERSVGPVFVPTPPTHT